MKQKIGIIVNGTKVSKQVNDLVELASSAQNYEITTLIVNNAEHQTNLFKKFLGNFQKRGFSRLISKILFRAICKLEKTILAKKSKYHHLYDQFDLTKYNFDIITVNPQISKSGLIYRYSDSDLGKIRKAGLNLLVRSGSGILKGEILTICPNGIISFHHADNNINRGGPPGFWEVYKQNPKTGFIIQRLTDELDGGDVLYKGFIRTSWFYSFNLANLYEISNPFMHKVLEDITSDAPSLSLYPKSPYSSQLYKNPKIHESIYYCFKTAAIFLSKKIRAILGIKNRWGIAYQFTENWMDAVLWRSKKIHNPKNRFLADPFVIKRNNKHYCFVEDFDYSINRGSISVYEITKEGYKELGSALKEDFHLAYPYLFEYGGELYMCPETAEKRDIRIYKCLEFPLKWEFHKKIMSDVSAADTAIFFYEDKWLLISNLDKSIVGEHFSQLHLFYNSNPLNADWVAHSNNPIIFDPLKARNGGLIIDNTGTYRVYQRQGFDTYGKSLGVAKIISMDKKNYSEKSLFEIEPDFFSNIKGTHTYNYADGLLVFDYSKTSNKRTGISYDIAQN